MDEILVMYDGECTFCDGFVKYVEENVSSSHGLSFIPLQEVNFDGKLSYLKEVESIIVLTNEGVILIKYKAVKAIFARLKPLKRLIYFWIFLDLPWINDKIYDFFAKYRKTFFGSHEYCRLPDRNVHVDRVESWLESVGLNIDIFSNT